jgi:hypothetical protein
MTARWRAPLRDVVTRGSSALSGCGAGCGGRTSMGARVHRRMNALAMHGRDGRWVVEPPRPMREWTWRTTLRRGEDGARSMTAPMRRSSIVGVTERSRRAEACYFVREKAGES